MSEGIWLDGLPYEPPLVGCVDCDDPVQPKDVMVAYVGGGVTSPLCHPCFDSRLSKSG